MDAKKWDGLKKKALLVLMTVVPAIASGVLAYTESRETSKKEATQVTKKAEAGYQVTRAAYEQMLKDISSLKTEIRLLKELLMNGNLAVVKGPNTGTTPLPGPMVPEAEVTDIEVKSPDSKTTVTLKKGDLPQDLDTAQKVLE